MVLLEQVHLPQTGEREFALLLACEQVLMETVNFFTLEGAHDEVYKLSKYQRNYQSSIAT